MNKFSSFVGQFRKDSGKESTQNNSNPNIPQAQHKRQSSVQPTQSTQGNQGRGGQLDNSCSVYTTNGGQIQMNQQTSRASILINTNNMDQQNRYFAKMIPNKAQKVVDNVMERYEKIKDIIEKNIKPNKYSLSDQEIQKLTISLSDFDQYKNKIETEYNEYQNQRQQTGSFEDQIQDMHLNKNLANCYSLIPKSFLIEYDNEEDNPFFNQIGRNVRALREYQNQLVEYLDEVELNLFYQVYFRQLKVLVSLIYIYKIISQLLNHKIQDTLINFPKKLGFLILKKYIISMNLNFYPLKYRFLKVQEFNGISDPVIQYLGDIHQIKFKLYFLCQFIQIQK